MPTGTEIGRLSCLSRRRCLRRTTAWTTKSARLIVYLGVGPRPLRRSETVMDKRSDEARGKAEFGEDGTGIERRAKPPARAPGSSGTRREFLLSSMDVFRIASAAAGFLALKSASRAQGEGGGETPFCNEYCYGHDTYYSLPGQNCGAFDCTSFACHGSLFDDFECGTSFDCTTYRCLSSFDNEDCEGTFECFTSYTVT